MVGKLDQLLDFMKMDKMQITKGKQVLWGSPGGPPGPPPRPGLKWKKETARWIREDSPREADKDPAGPGRHDSWDPGGMGPDRPKGGWPEGYQTREERGMTNKELAAFHTKKYGSATPGQGATPLSGWDSDAEGETDWGEVARAAAPPEDKSETGRSRVMDTWKNEIHGQVENVLESFYKVAELQDEWDAAAAKFDSPPTTADNEFAAGHEKVLNLLNQVAEAWSEVQDQEQNRTESYLNRDWDEARQDPRVANIQDRGEGVLYDEE